MTNFLYNPDRKSKAQLIAEFVVRTDVLNEIMHDLETSDMKTPEQHYLLVGQRGSGKTTLLNRIKYAVEDSEKLKDWLIPVIFSEEQYNITELANLWENVGQVLEDYHGFEGLSKEVEKHVYKDDFDEKAYELLERELTKRKKKLVLLIDNIGDFLKKLDDNETRRLRELLQTKSSIRVIAGSSFYLESILDYKQPLFEFFKMIRLDRLTDIETQKLLRKLGDVFNETEKIEMLINDNPERIETLRILTGGVPRTIALMFRIFIDYAHDSSVQDLEKILDAVTPLYKHRMDDLPTQQQKIVDAVAKKWDAVTVKELKEKIRLDSKTISAQLNQLEKNQIVEKISTTTKNYSYLLKERFFNIWYLMRYGRRYDKQRVIWLVRFFEHWLNRDELENRIINYVKKIKDGDLDKDTIFFYGEVYSSIAFLSSKMKLLLKESAPEVISKKLDISDVEIYKVCNEYIREGEWEEALQTIYNLNNVDDDIRMTIHFLVYKAHFGEFMRSFVSKFEGFTEESITKLRPVDWSMILSSVYTLCVMAIVQEKWDVALKQLKLYLSIGETVVGATLPEGEVMILNGIFVALLAKKQYQTVSSVFEASALNLKDRLKPTYYTLLYLRDGIKNFGEEFESSVNEILNLVKKLDEGFQEAANRVEK